MHDQNVARTWDAKRPKCIVRISSMHKVSDPTKILRENVGQQCLATVPAMRVPGNVDLVHDAPVGTSGAGFKSVSTPHLQFR